MKQHIALFYITLILILKVGGLHAFAHATDVDDAQHCEVCVVETAVNFTPLIEADDPALPETTYYYSERELIQETPYVDARNSYLGSYHSTRPLPQFL